MIIAITQMRFQTKMIIAWGQSKTLARKIYTEERKNIRLLGIPQEIPIFFIFHKYIHMNYSFSQNALAHVSKSKDNNDNEGTSSREK